MNDVFPIEHGHFPMSCLFSGVIYNIPKFLLLPMRFPTSTPHQYLTILLIESCQGKRTDIKPHEWDKFGYFAKVFDRFLRDDESRVDRTTKIEAGHDCSLIISIKKINRPGRIDQFFWIFLGFVFCFGRKEPN